MKILIIGSGIGGSAIGALIAKETSHQVQLFEKNKLIGGRCASYEKKDSEGRKWLFDVGCHIFSTSDKGPLGDILNRCGKGDDVKWSYTQNPGPRVNIMGMELIKRDKDKRDKARAKNTLIEKKKETFTDYISNFPMDRTKDYDEKSLMELFREYFGSRRGMMEKLMYSMQAAVMFGTSPHTTSAGEFLRCISFNNQKVSMGYPLGGAGIIPTTYCDVIIENRGSVLLGRDGNIKKIIVENNKVKGVEAGPDNQYYEADIIIANSDIKTTVLHLIGERYFPKEYVEYIKSLKWGSQVCSLKIGLDKIITDHKMLTYVPKIELEEMKGKSLHQMDFTDLILKKGLVPKITGQFIVPVSNHDPSLAPKGCQNIHAVTPTALGEVIKWSAKEEEQWEETCLRSLSSLWPDLEEHLVVKDFIATSQLEARFGKEGAGTGTAQSIDQVGKNRPSMVSPIEGLYYCSGDAGGWEIGTELPARSALELFDLLKKKDEI